MSAVSVIIMIPILDNYVNQGICSFHNSTVRASSSDALNRANVNLVSDDQCRSIHNRSDAETRDYLCAGYVERGGIDQCRVSLNTDAAPRKFSNYY